MLRLIIIPIVLSAITVKAQMLAFNDRPNSALILKENGKTASLNNLIDPYLIKIFDGPIPDNFIEIDNSLEGPGVYYDSTFDGELFGFVPKEFIFKNLEGESHVQLSYQFEKKDKGENGYKPTLEIVDQLTAKLGKPKVEWWKNQMNFVWQMNNMNVKISHLELNELPLVIVRMDITGSN